MLKNFLQRKFSPLVLRLTNRYSSRPNKVRVFEALSKLSADIIENPGKKGPLLEIDQFSKIIIFSDQHKGARDKADDFTLAEPNYLAALKHYNDQEFTLINLGDSEELWENLLPQVKKHNKATFEAEQLFLKRNSFFKVFGNHDLFWDNDPLAGFQLKDIYQQDVKIFEGVILKYSDSKNSTFFLLTHGHQGDMQSDGNWFSKWFVSRVWAPLQAFLEVNPNTPAYDTSLKSIHNQLMYEWVSTQDNMFLITGHTHQPVFRSLTYLERLYYQLEQATALNDEARMSELKTLLRTRIAMGETVPIFKAYKPTYFNTGCCCFSDGDITGIEIEGGTIRLIKWEYGSVGQIPERSVLEEWIFSSLKS